MTATINTEDLARAVMALAGQQAALQTAFKAVSSIPTATYGHGQQTPGGTSGLFSFPGLEPDIINAMVMPNTGLLDILPSRTSNRDRLILSIMTGVTAGSGSEPVGVCDDPPISGLMKLCSRMLLWGRFSRETPVFELDRFGRYRDRSDFNDLQLIGDPVSSSSSSLLPSMPGAASPGRALQSELAKAFFEFAVSWARDFAPLIYTGNPSNNTYQQGYKEPYGLDYQINTGYRDLETGTACRAADSIVVNANSREVNTNASWYVAQITSIVRQIFSNAARMRLDPLRLVIVMREELFYVLTEAWPCAYFTYRCGGEFSSSQTQVIDAGDTIALRDNMRNGKFLLVDGRQVEVVFDDTIPETSLPGSSFRETVYFLPLRYKGNRPGVYLEYMNYDAPGAAMEAAREFGVGANYYTTNGGRYLWHAKPPTNFCIQSLAKTEWRVVLEVPHLAARLDNVKYTPAAHLRDWDPDGSFYVDGGHTTRTDNSYYSPHS